MSAEEGEVTGPDLSQGVTVESIPEGGMLGGHVGNEPVLLSRDGDTVYAIGGRCTHYGGPLIEGLVVGRTVRCPWHHACFDLQTGEAVCAPALNPVSRWTVERDGALVKVTAETPAPDGATPLTTNDTSGYPDSIVIIGAGAAGNAAAEMLRRSEYRGKLTMIGRDPSVPYDRPNLSKDYLAGNAPEEWIPLRP
ncbi:MAG TPA: Rieske 2Fe-2S domain-containing protein, partial [Gemmatimonadaceae bacterium]|nr:Rieske 2Fe-2S domain-containing protein [Gemmatimonadaceae bacterium]